MNDTPSTTLSADTDRTFAILAHLGGLLTSWLAPLIIFLIKKSDPQATFVTDQAKEALNYQITLFFAYVACFILSFVLIGFFLFMIVMMANVVLCILAAVKSSNGVLYRYPLTIRLIK